MPELTTRQRGPREYDVEVHDGGRTTTHRVSVPERVGAVGLDAHDPERVVRESFGFLLEREPASAILPEFSLDVITRYFPEYPDELARRLTGER